MADPTSAAMSVDYDPITGRPLPVRSHQHGVTGAGFGGGSTGVTDPNSAAMSVDYDPISGRTLRSPPHGGTGGGFAGGSTGATDPNSTLGSVNYDFLNDGSGHNEDADSLTAMGIEIKERFKTMQAAFLKLDQNRDGRISKKELLQMCKQWNIPTSEAERVLQAADLDHNGTLDFNEFAQRFDPFNGFTDECEMTATFGSSHNPAIGGSGARHNPADDRPIGGSGARHNHADDRPIGGSGARHNAADDRPIGGAGHVAAKGHANDRPIGGSGGAPHGGQAVERPTHVAAKGHANDRPIGGSGGAPHGGTGGGFAGGSTGATDPNSTLGSVNYDFLNDGSGHNEDADSLTAMGIEIKERFKTMQAAFLKLDQNRDGRISKKELLEMCKKWNIPTSEAERVLQAADLDHNGTLDFNEFAQRFDPFDGFTDECEMTATFGSSHNPADDRPIGGSGATHNAADARPIGGSGARHNAADDRNIGGPGHAAAKGHANDRPIGGSGGAAAKTHPSEPPIGGSGGDAAHDSQVDTQPSAKQEILAMFQKWDMNKDGVIDINEFTQLLRKMGFTEEEIPMMFEAADANNDHVVDIQEFFNWVYSGDDKKEDGNSGVEQANATVSSMGTTTVLVYGRAGDAKTDEMCKKLEKAGIRYEKRDFDKDKGYEEALAASDFSGQARPPVVCFMNKAWCEDPDAKPDPTDMFVVPFADTVAMELRREVGMFSGANAEQPVRNDATMDEEIAERFKTMQDAFLKVDADRDGKITKQELLQRCKEWHIPVAEAERVLQEADLNKDGTLDFDEFAIRFNGRGANHHLKGSHGLHAHR